VIAIEMSVSCFRNLNSYDYNTGFNESIWTRFGWSSSWTSSQGHDEADVDTVPAVFAKLFHYFYNYCTSCATLR